jgi:hypothetical protein
MSLSFRLAESGPWVDAIFDTEPAPRKWILSKFLLDMYGQEDVYLAELAKAEAGEPNVRIWNNHVSATMNADRVDIEDMWDPQGHNPDIEGPPPGTTLSLAETKQLILDWIEAKKKWKEARRGRE